MRKAFAIGGLALALVLAGCGGGTADTDPGMGDDGGSGYGAPSSESSSEASEPAASGSDLMVADSSLGEIVVTGDRMTAYMFDNDTQGADASSCTGDCLTKWPPILTESEMPEVEGVTGELGTIETPEGDLQITLDGWPLYTFAGDAAAGDVNGQGVGGIWWVLTPAGEKIEG
ncbi:hypothetical protein [Microbacterium sp. YJN-G]|uniref:COG4315 family predicted lipoprotein n=1 Tax=Microbacterium sp. YJN-G TaxID=2763257 RepID=UPI0018780735|nr:hypothetical protein [Microbacterium sp. YJN-G]